MNSAQSEVSKREATWLLRDKYHNVKCLEYETDLKRLAAGEPLGYVIGWVPFCGLIITLDSRPLIPRPETEWWTEKMIANELRKNTGGLQVLDLCAGSGAIGCAVLRAYPNAHVTFSDNDKAHEATIRTNIATNKINPRCAHIITGDLFDALESKTFDLIAINPPYIPEHRKLPHEVNHYEPHKALYSGSDGLAITARIAKRLRTHLNRCGRVWIEVDSEYAKQAQKLFTDEGFTAELHTDPYGRPRVLYVY